MNFATYQDEPRGRWGHVTLLTTTRSSDALVNLSDEAQHAPIRPRPQGVDEVLDSIFADENNTLYC